MPVIQLDTDLPVYARDMLWLVGDDESPAKIKAGDVVELPNKAGSLRWGTADGSPLMQWPADLDRDRLVWKGRVAVSGFVEVTHVMNRGDLEVMVLEVSGNPRKSATHRLPSWTDLRQKPYKRSDFVSATEEARHWYAFLLPLESALSDFAHHALVNGYAVDCYGVLAEDAAGFDEWLGLPLLLESMTLYSPL